MPLFDQNYQGLPARSFNMLETADRFSGLLGIALFIDTGLKQGEHVTLITFDEPEKVLDRFLKFGFDFQAMLDNEDFCILSYKASFSRSLNISTDYQALFSEIKLLGGEKASRFAFLNADLLFNLESHNLATISVSKIHEAVRAVDGVVLAQFTTVEGEPHQRLREVCSSLLDCYLVISQVDNKMSLKVKAYH